VRAGGFERVPRVERATVTGRETPALRMTRDARLVGAGPITGTEQVCWTRWETEAAHPTMRAGVNGAAPDTVTGRITGSIRVATRVQIAGARETGIERGTGTGQEASGGCVAATVFRAKTPDGSSQGSAPSGAG